MLVEKGADVNAQGGRFGIGGHPYWYPRWEYEEEEPSEGEEEW
jgi:hypothetical protein